MLQHILWFYTLILPLCLPWIVSLFFLGRHFGTKNAIKMFALDAKSARLLATKCTSASLIFCLPFALLMPIWCGMNLLLYFVLAVGVQYFSITLSLPAEDKSKKWRWAWASNAAAVGISTVFFVATLACMWFYQTQTRGLQPPHNYGSPGSSAAVDDLRRSLRHPVRRSIRYPDGSISLMTDWYTVPPSYAGKWRVDALRRTKATGGDWQDTGAMKDVEYFVGQYADKTGQIWQHRGTAGFARSDYFPFCGSYEGKEFYYSAKKGSAVGQIRPEKFAANDLPGLQFEGKDELFCGSHGSKVTMTDDNSFEESTVIKTSDTKIPGVIYMHEYTAKAKKISPFKPRIDLQTPDGKPLYPDFVDFLREYGMSDRIPAGPQ